MYKTVPQYFNEHLEEIFSHKEVKKNKEKLLRELMVLLEKTKRLISDSDMLLATLIVDSYKNYNELVKENLKLKQVYNDYYHYIYIHASYVAQRSFMESNSYLNEIEEKIMEYHFQYASLFEERIPKNHYQLLVKLAFLNVKIEDLGIEKKTMKKVSPEEAYLLKEKSKVKALIY